MSASLATTDGQDVLSATWGGASVARLNVLDGWDTTPSLATLVLVEGADTASNLSLVRAAVHSKRGTNWLPPVQQPIGTAQVRMPDGSMQTVSVTIDAQWYRGLDELFNRRAGGVSGPNLADAATNAASAVAAVESLAPAVASAQQTADAVASAAASSRDVLVAADVPGATEIPIVAPRNLTTTAD